MLPPWVPVIRLYPRQSGRGLACDEPGVALGSAALVWRRIDRDGRGTYQVAEPAEVVRILDAAFGGADEPQLAHAMCKLGIAADALAKGDMSRAALAALDLRMPELSDDAIDRIQRSEARCKYNPYHRPPGPGGGEFTSAPEAGAETQVAEDSRGPLYDERLGRRRAVAEAALAAIAKLPDAKSVFIPVSSIGTETIIIIRPHPYKAAASVLFCLTPVMRRREFPTDLTRSSASIFPSRATSRRRARFMAIPGATPRKLPLESEISRRRMVTTCSCERRRAESCFCKHRKNKYGGFAHSIDGSF